MPISAKKCPRPPLFLEFASGGTQKIGKKDLSGSPQNPEKSTNTGDSDEMTPAVMLREPAGEMDLENGFTDAHKMQQTLIFPRLSGRQKIHGIHFCMLLHIQHVKKCCWPPKSAEDKTSRFSRPPAEVPNRQNRRPHIGFSTLTTNAQDEELDLAATASTSTLDRTRFQAQFGVDPLNIGDSDDLGLSPPPHLRFGKKGFWG